MKNYDCIVIGAGAAGLFYAAGDSTDSDKLILEKTSRPGQKLLMSGSGMCNLTHAGSIKDFIGKYGEHGQRIRSCLYRHNNLALRSAMEAMGVPTTERPDGKVFPTSMKARDVLNALIAKAQHNGWRFRYHAGVTALAVTETGAHLTLTDGSMLTTKKLIIATGGSSYPDTGSDGSFFDISHRDLGLCIVSPRPALAPVYVEHYLYSDLSGISFDDVEVSCAGHKCRGPLLFTHKGFSGPAILHISQYVNPGSLLHINYLPARNINQVYQKIQADHPGSKTGIANYIATEFGLPKAFVNTMFTEPSRKLSTIGHKELENVTRQMMDRVYHISGTGGWNDAMVTAGGVCLDQIDLKTMSLNTKKESLTGADIRIIGEALDINGDTGGYNLQFAYSSAMAAL